MNETEGFILAKLMQKPSLIHTVSVQPNWFAERALQELVAYMVKLDGDWRGERDLHDRFTLDHAGESQAINWQEIDEDGRWHYAMDDVLDGMRRQYLTRQAQAAAQNYAIHATTDGLATLKDAVSALDADAQAIVGRDTEELGKDFEERLNKDDEVGIKTFFPIDSALGGGFHGGQLITIGARPAVGKSAFAVNLIQKAQQNNDNMTLDLFALEMADSENYNRLLQLETGIPSKKFRVPKKFLSADQKKSAKAAVTRLNGWNLSIYDGATTASQIISIITKRAQAAQMGHYLAIVDYLQLVEPERQTGNRVTDVATITRAFKIATTELNVPIIMLSQLNRESAKRDNKGPELFDLRESGSIEQDSNMVGFLINGDVDNGEIATSEPTGDEYKRPIVFKIAKNREGPLTSIPFVFIPDKMEFYPAVMG